MCSQQLKLTLLDKFEIFLFLLSFETHCLRTGFWLFITCPCWFASNAEYLVQQSFLFSPQISADLFLLNFFFFWNTPMHLQLSLCALFNFSACCLLLKFVVKTRKLALKHTTETFHECLSYQNTFLLAIIWALLRMSAEFSSRQTHASVHV